LSTLKIGIIGIGGIAKTHMPGWQESQHSEVIASSDINETVLKEWGSNYQISRLYNDPYELIEDPEIDVIDICTPNNYHCDLAIKAMEAGKHVICEKPLAPIADQIRSMIKVRDRTNKKLMCAQHFRFRENSKMMKSEAEQIGFIYHARSWMLRRNALPNRIGFLMKEHSGGGPCIDIGVHVLDLTLWFMGNPKPISVTGVSRTELAKEPGAFSMWGEYDSSIMDVEDFAAAFVRFENGAVLILEVSWMLHHETDTEDMQVWLYGKNGGLHWPRCEKISSDNVNNNLLFSKFKNNKIETEPHAKECIEFAESVVNNQPVPVPAEHSLQVMEILNGVYKSQETGKEVIL
jgi:predicted dehydrogenase